MDTRMLRSLGCCALVDAIMSGPATAQIALEGIVVTSTKTSEAAIDALSGTSALGTTQLDEQFQADKASQFLRTIPGVTTSETARDSAVAINLRGLQDFGRVNVLIEGARQNFQRSGHNADGVFYIEPEMLKGVDITRGPTATIYGSGAIGGVAAFSVLDADDILRGNETAALRSRTRYTSNGDGMLYSQTGAVKVGNFDVLGQYNSRSIGNYEDGAGREISDSGRDNESSLVKARWRVAPGHQITGTVIDYNSEFVDRPSLTSTTRRASEVNNQQYTLGYTFARPDAPLVDFSAKVYQNNTSLSQRRIDSNSKSEPAGSFRTFDLETQGFDVSNTSRFKFGSTKWALTYGADGFRDEVVTTDTLGSSNLFTPGGRRTVAGAFIQSQTTIFDTVDVIAALRYDTYELSGGATEVDGSRVSPKITVGYTLAKGMTLFGTYAEGYRAPAVTETLITGTHPAPASFTFLPNPNLRPEVAHNLEAGVNVKFDNIFKRADALRGRIVVFQNKIDDFIDPTFVPPGGPFQYVNISRATLEGIELEAMYDARAWFAGVGAHRIRGTNEESGEPVYSVPADRVTLTAGFRAFEERLIAGSRVHFVGAQDRVPSAFAGSGVIVPSEAYTVVDLFAQYIVNDYTTLNLNIDNLFDVDYREYREQQNSPGLSARLGFTMRFGYTPGVTP